MSRLSLEVWEPPSASCADSGPFYSQLILFTYKTLRAKVIPTETHTIQPQRESGPTAPVANKMARLTFILDLLDIPEQLGPSCL